MIAPMRAMPIDRRPAGRVQDRRADARLVHRHRRTAAAALGVMTSAIPPRQAERRQKRPERRVLLEPGEEPRACVPTRASPSVMSQREPFDPRSCRRSGRKDDQHGHRQERGAGLHRRVSEDVLHVEGDEEEDAEHGERDEEHHEVRARERSVSEERQVEHWHALTVLE